MAFPSIGRRHFRFLAGILASLILMLSASGVVYGEFSTVINLPPDALPLTLESNTQVNVAAGGSIPAFYAIGEDQVSHENIEVNVTEGAVGQGLRVYSGGTLNISGGVVGAFEGGTIHGLVFNPGSELNVSGGAVSYVAQYEETLATISGGEVEGVRLEGGELEVTGGVVKRIRVRHGGEVTLSGGKLSRLPNGGNGDCVFAAGTSLNMTGGVLYEGTVMYSGSTMHLSGGAVGHDFEAPTYYQFHLYGGEFQVNGVAVAPGQLQLDRSDVLTATLEDGSVVMFARDDVRSVNLVEVPIPAADLTPAVLNAPTAHPGLRPGQSLTVASGGEIGEYYQAIGGTLNVDGGQVGRGLEVLDSNLHLAEGIVGSFAAFGDSQVQIDAALVDGDVLAAGATELTVDGGQIGKRLTLRDQATAVITSGRLDDGLVLYEESSATIYSGQVGGAPGFGGGSVRVESGSSFDIHGGAFHGTLSAFADTAVNLYGERFLLDGQPVAGLEAAGDSLVLLAREESVLTAILADGTPFDVLLRDRTSRTEDYVSSLATLTLNLVEAALPGDFNHDGSVDVADYSVWRDGLGTYYTADDYLLWQSRFGQTLGANAGAARVPEPAALALIAVALGALSGRRRCSRCR